MEHSFSLLDKMISVFDKSIRTMFAAHVAARPYPAQETEAPLTPAEKKHSAGLMRVNHTGEICAQALYLGQALTARDPAIKQKMQSAADEEIDHLAWCETRLTELNNHTSYLGPLWFIGSFAIGTIAGLIGDKWNLGFVAETERQVVQHLQGHLSKLPEKDSKTYQIILQMQADEQHHASMAVEAGAATLPKTVQHIMTWTAKVMTTTAYHI